ncbi:MAG: hypothetical protein R3343_11450 [Nitriliruptorales bacterium]|nr:hypothetical protein [Nitriliruptorales bacterium]
MRLSWFGDFFGALPDALRALYQFGDPAGRGNGWWGIIILLIWGVLLTAVPLLIAKRTYGKHEWVSATMGVVAGLSIFWWVYGILPSAWIYYLDSSQEILAGPIIPDSAGITIGDYRVDIASNLYQVIRDLVVVIEHLLAFALTFWAALKIQEKYPKTLAPGETKPEAGGYK